MPALHGGAPRVNEAAEGRCSSEVGAVARDSCAYIISQRSQLGTTLAIALPKDVAKLRRR